MIERHEISVQLELSDLFDGAKSFGRSCIIGKSKKPMYLQNKHCSLAHRGKRSETRERTLLVYSRVFASTSAV